MYAATRPGQFAELLRAHRLSRGATQRELADVSTVSVRAIRDLELGRANRPRRETVQLIAHGLGLSGRERSVFELAARQVTTAADVKQLYDAAPAAPPAPLDALVGRQAELAVLRGTLMSGSHRLVTITGPSGVGKTVLALAAAADLHRSEAMPVLWSAADRPDGSPTLDGSRRWDGSPRWEGSDSSGNVDTPVGRGGLGGPGGLGRPGWSAGMGDGTGRPDGLGVLIHARIRALLGPSDAAVEDLRALIGQRPTLMVLDGYDPTRTRLDRVVGLLQACPGLRVLATARAPFDVHGERVAPLPPLAVPGEGEHRSVAALLRVASVRLLLAHARRVRPDFTLSGSNAAPVAALCRGLDGLPGALVAVGSYFHVDEPAMLLRYAGHDPFELLLDALPDLRESLRRALRRLNPVERTVLTRLTSAEPGWSVTDVAALTGVAAVAGVRAIRGLLTLGLIRPLDGSDRTRLQVLHLLRFLGRDSTQHG